MVPSRQFFCLFAISPRYFETLGASFLNTPFRRLNVSMLVQNAYGTQTESFVVTGVSCYSWAIVFMLVVGDRVLYSLAIRLFFLSLIVLVVFR